MYILKMKHLILIMVEEGEYDESFLSHAYKQL